MSGIINFSTIFHTIIYIYWQRRGAKVMFFPFVLTVFGRGFLYFLLYLDKNAKKSTRHKQVLWIDYSFASSGASLA